MISGYRLIDTEIPLHSPLKIFKADTKCAKYHIGRIDVLFAKGYRKYLGEIKYANSSSDFWDATKIIAYYNYYKWQFQGLYDIGKLNPCVLMPKKSLKIEHQITAGLLGIDIFTIDAIEGGYKIEDASYHIAKF